MPLRYPLVWHHTFTVKEVIILINKSSFGMLLAACISFPAISAVDESINANNTDPRNDYVDSNIRLYAGRGDLFELTRRPSLLSDRFNTELKFQYLRVAKDRHNLGHSPDIIIPNKINSRSGAMLTLLDASAIPISSGNDFVRIKNSNPTAVSLILPWVGEYTYTWDKSGNIETLPKKATITLTSEYTDERNIMALFNHYDEIEIFASSADNHNIYLPPTDGKSKTITINTDDITIDTSVFIDDTAVKLKAGEKFTYKSDGLQWIGDVAYINDSNIEMLRSGELLTTYDSIILNITKSYNNQRIEMPRVRYQDQFLDDNAVYIINETGNDINVHGDKYGYLNWKIKNNQGVGLKVMFYTSPPEYFWEQFATITTEE